MLIFCPASRWQLPAGGPNTRYFFRFSSISHREILGVEFFDFVFGRSGGCGRGCDFDLDEGFGKDFGVDYERITRAFGLGFVLELACLRIGVDGEEVTAGGEAGEEGAQAPFVLFNAIRRIKCIISRP